MLIAGNVSKDVRTRTLRVCSGSDAQQSQDAVIIAEMVEAILASSPLSSQLFDRALILPEGLFPILIFVIHLRVFRPRIQFCMGNPTTKPS